MANAKKCDVCGGLYEEYNNKPAQLRQPNCISIYNNIGILHGVDTPRSNFMELCPTCMKAIHNCLTERTKGGEE